MITILGTDKVIKVTDLQLLELQMFILYVLIWTTLHTSENNQKFCIYFHSNFIHNCLWCSKKLTKWTQKNLTMISQNISNLPIFLDIIIICSSHFLEFISYPQNKHYNQQCVFLFLKKGLLTPLMSLFTYLIFFLFFQVPIIKNLKPIANKLWLCPFF